MGRWLLLLLLLFLPRLNADTILFQWDNDFVFKTDQSYTNGASLTWMDDAYAPDDTKSPENGYSRFVTGAIPFLRPDESKRYSAGMGLSQMTMTPEDKKRSSVNYDDVPYAGYLALSLYLFEWDTDTFDEYRLDIGVVGPESEAEAFQKLVHNLRGFSELAGWDTQLGTYWTVNMMYQHGEKVWQKHYKSGWSADWLMSYGLQAGTFHTSLFGSSSWRVGKNYVQNFNVYYPYLKTDASQLGACENHKGFGWSLSTGLSVEGIAYSYIFDKAKEKGYNINKSNFSAALFAGSSLYLDSMRLTFFIQSQSPYIKESIEWMNFGGVKLLVDF